MEFKGTKGNWKIKHSESKDAFNIVGTELGDKYKIARVPYHLINKEGYTEWNEKNKSQAEADAKLIAAAPELLAFIIELAEDNYSLPYKSNYDKAIELIKKATK